jgi:coenzyme F420-reducing hydrogenase alpha subunit
MTEKTEQCKKLATMMFNNLNNICESIHDKNEKENIIMKTFELYIITKKGIMDGNIILTDEIKDEKEREFSSSKYKEFIKSALK